MVEMFMFASKIPHLLQMQFWSLNQVMNILLLLVLSETAEKHTYIRFLVSNAAAGSVIGKGGSTITEFQSKSGARIQLSRNHEFFPGTSDRIIMISGTIDEVLKAMELILAKLLNEVIFMITFNSINSMYVWW